MTIETKEMMRSHRFDFSCDVLEQSHDIPVLVDFWAEWCAPCRMLGPVLEEVAARHAGEFVLVKINTEKYPDISRKYGIRSIPAVKLFIDGEVADEFVGALSEPMIEQWLKKAIPSRYVQELKLASDLVSQGKEHGALPILEQVLRNEPGNTEAAAILVKLKLFNNPGQTGPLIDVLENEREFSELVDAINTLVALFSRKKTAFPDSPVRDQYLTAVEELRGKNFDSALTAFIGVLRQDRYYDDDGSRKACIAVFKYLGEDNPVTLKHRRIFDRALY